MILNAEARAILVKLSQTISPLCSALATGTPIHAGLNLISLQLFMRSYRIWAICTLSPSSVTSETSETSRFYFKRTILLAGYFSSASGILLHGYLCTCTDLSWDCFPLRSHIDAPSSTPFNYLTSETLIHCLLNEASSNHLFKMATTNLIPLPCIFSAST